MHRILSKVELKAIRLALAAACDRFVGDDVVLGADESVTVGKVEIGDGWKVRFPGPVSSQSAAETRRQRRPDRLVATSPDGTHYLSVEDGVARYRRVSTSNSGPSLRNRGARPEHSVVGGREERG